MTPILEDLDYNKLNHTQDFFNDEIDLTHSPPYLVLFIIHIKHHTKYHKKYQKIIKCPRISLCKNLSEFL